MNVFEKIKEISNLLDEVDNFEKIVPDTQREFDLKLSDLYHKLENMSLTAPKCYKFCKELKIVLNERREFKNNAEILTVYNREKQKMFNGVENRKILLSNIGKREKQLCCKYKPRIYTEEELNEKIGV